MTKKIMTKKIIIKNIMTITDNGKKKLQKKIISKNIMTKKDNAITDHLFNLRRENLHQGLGGKFPH